MTWADVVRSSLTVDVDVDVDAKFFIHLRFFAKKRPLQSYVDVNADEIIHVFSGLQEIFTCLNFHPRKLPWV